MPDRETMSRPEPTFRPAPCRPEAEGPDLLLLGPMVPAVAARLDEAFRVHRLFACADPETMLAALASDLRGMAVIGGRSPVDAAFIDRFPRLEIIANYGVGYDTVDVDHAARRGIVVTHTPDVLTEEVADLTIALLLATIRRLPQADRYVRAGRWRAEPFPFTHSLRDKRIGIAGMGRIGRAVARRLDAFDLPGLAYFGRHPQPDLPHHFHDSLISLARAVDILIVLTPGGSATQGLVDAAVIHALGPNGVLINVARGSVVDESALIQALREGRLGAAGLDVFAREPDVPADLMAMEQVVLLPHVGSATHETRAAMTQLVVDNLLAWFAGRPSLTPVPETPDIRRGETQA